MPLTGCEIEAEAFRMFEKWKELFAPDYDGDILELVAVYATAPPEQHAAACRAACVMPPWS